MSNNDSTHQGVGIFCGCLTAMIFALAFRPFDSAGSAQFTVIAGMIIGWIAGYWVSKNS